MTHFLVDTNHVSKILTGETKIEERLVEAKDSGDLFGITTTILGELYHAAYASRRKDENLSKLKHFLPSIILWGYDSLVAEEYGKIQAELKKKGKPIPASDAQIAAVARYHDLTILSDDRHFEFVNNLTVENWIRSD